MVQDQSAPHHANNVADAASDNGYLFPEWKTGEQQETTVVALIGNEMKLLRKMHYLCDLNNTDFCFAGQGYWTAEKQLGLSRSGVQRMISRLHKRRYLVVIRQGKRNALYFPAPKLPHGGFRPFAAEEVQSIKAAHSMAADGKSEHQSVDQSEGQSVDQSADQNGERPYEIELKELSSSSKAAATPFESNSEFNPPIPPAPQKVSPAEFMDVWNALPEPFPKIRDMSAGRKKALATRLKEPAWVRDWREALESLPSRAFAAGKGKPRSEGAKAWVLDCDFFLRPDSVTKILEGKYDLAPAARTGSPFKDELAKGTQPLEYQEARRS